MAYRSLLAILGIDTKNSVSVIPRGLSMPIVSIVSQVLGFFPLPRVKADRLHPLFFMPPVTPTDSRCKVCGGIIAKKVDYGSLLSFGEGEEFFCSVCGIMYKFLPKEKPDGGEEEKTIKV
jgi:hypothetical protein